MWVEPIFDRTQSDIDNKTSKAFFNATDLNRIENNIDFLKTYYHTTVTPYTWNYGDIVTQERVATILSYLQDIKNKVADSPSIPANITTYQEANELEYFIKFVYEYYRHRIQVISQPVAGFYCCGEPIVLITGGR